MYDIVCLVNFFFCRPVPLHIRIINYEIIFIGVVGGIIATAIAFDDIFNDVTFVPPCYINITAANTANTG